MEHVELVSPPYRVVASVGGLPDLYAAYLEHAALVDKIDLDSPHGATCFFAVGNQRGWPKLVVAQRYEPAGYGFRPGILVVPETSIVFIGAGECILAYRIDPRPERLWIDHAPVGFWSWSRFDDLVFMSAEIELAAWTIQGEKRWSAYVEPPWEFSVSNGTVELDVMGEKRSFNAAGGPKS